MIASLNTRLGYIIRQRRVLLGLSQSELGKRVGVTYQQVQKYEKASSPVAFPMLVELAGALNMLVSELVAAATGEKAGRSDGITERETLEMMKRLAKLTPVQRRAVRLLVQNLAITD